MTSKLRKEDILDLDITDATELASDGSTVFLSGVTVVSTTASSKQVVLSGVYIINVPENRVEANDKLTLSGTSPGGAADGNYTVSDIIDDVTLTVVESIADSTGGTATFKHKSGALRVGIETLKVPYGKSNSVHALLTEFGLALCLDDGPGYLNGVYKEITPTGNAFPTNAVWYTTSGKTQKIAELILTRDAQKKSTSEVWKFYDSNGTLYVTITDTINYSGPFEINRSRSISYA